MRIITLTLITIAMVLIATEPKLCSRQNAMQINLAEYKIPRTNTYKFAIEMRKGPIHVQKNQNGTAFQGNLSTLVLKNQQGVEFVYDGVEFGFECPALHKPTKSNEQLIELQIIYRVRHSQQGQNKTIRAPYEQVLFSFPFMVSDYVPENSLSINNMLDSLEKNQEIDLKNVVKQLVSLETLVYTTRDWKFGDRSVLRMVRKEIRLMNKVEFKRLKLLIEDEVQLQTNDTQAKSNLKKPQKIYQIKFYPFEQSIAFRKEDL